MNNVTSLPIYGERGERKVHLIENLDKCDVGIFGETLTKGISYVVAINDFTYSIAGYKSFGYQFELRRKI